MQDAPHLVQMQNKWADKGVSVIGITQHSKDAAASFCRTTGVNYPVIYDAEELRERFGVRMLWGTVVYLVNPDGEVLSDDMDEIDEILTNSLS